MNRQSYTISTLQDMEQAVEAWGILPLFRNEIPGFSIEEHAAPEAWYSNESDDWKIWNWKGPVIRDTGCAYGKFLGGKAVFISRKWFPDFANWRRDGYDFDARYEDELAPYTDKVLFDLLEQKAPVLSTELKKAGNYRKGGNRGFDTIITRLQAQCYVLTSDFVYRKDRFGRDYGWGLAVYSTPEKFMGKAFTDAVYRREPEESYARVLAHLRKLLPEVREDVLARFLRSGYAGSAGKLRTGGVKSWLVPSNPKYFDVVTEFRRREVISWKQGNDNIQVGDLIYLYVGAPYSAILFRAEVTEKDIPYNGKAEYVNIRKLMRIRRLDEYSPERLCRKVLGNYGIVSVRCTRSMPADLERDLLAGKI